MDILKKNASFMENRAYFSDYPYKINSSCVKEFIKAIKTLDKDELVCLNEYNNVLLNKQKKNEEFSKMFDIDRFDRAVDYFVYKNKCLNDVNKEIFNDGLNEIQKRILTMYCEKILKGEDICNKILEAMNNVNLKKIEVENKRIESNKKKLQMNIARLAKQFEGEELDKAIFELNKNFEMEEKKKKLDDKFNLNFGSAVHAICLEGKNFDEAVKESFESEISEEQEKLIKVVVERYNKCGFTFQDKIAEGVFFKNYLDMELKAKMDLICEVDNKIYIVDLKTISQIDRIHNNIEEYAYWFQLLYYKYILECEGVKIDDLILIFVSKKPEIKALDDEYYILKFSELSPNEKNKRLPQFDEMMGLYKVVRDFAYSKENLSYYLKSKFCIL